MESDDLPATEDVRKLLGKRVRVKMVRGDESGDPLTICEGMLVGFGDGGDFEIFGDDNMVHYCWPMLEITELNDDQ